MAEGSEIEVRDLHTEEIPAAVGVLARGMRDNPLHIAAYGEDPDRREVVHGKLMAAVLRTFTAQEPICAVEAGDGTIVGVTGVSPPGCCEPDAVQRLKLAPTLLVVGPRTGVRVGKWRAEWSRRDPEEPHSHLGPLAVDRHRQGKGIGSLIMAEHCRRLDAGGEVGYLETDKDVNVTFYERFGYEVVEEAEVIGVPNWFMRRPAGSG